MTDPVEQISDALVTHLNGLETGSLGFVFQAEKTDDPDELLYAEQPDLKVLVVPFGETAERIGRGGQAIETYQVNVIVVKKLDIVTRDALSLFARQLKAAIRPNRMAGYGWAGDETVTKYDPKILRELNQFASLTRFSYQGTA
jgi:hypothetical protein